MFTNMKNKAVAQTFRKAISKREGISAMAGTSGMSAEGTTHSLAQEEVVAFAGEHPTNANPGPGKPLLRCVHCMSTLRTLGLTLALENLKYSDTYTV